MFIYIIYISATALAARRRAGSSWGSGFNPWWSVPGGGEGVQARAGGGRGGGVLLGPGNPIPRNSVFPPQLLFSTFFLARVPERLFRPKSPKSGPKGTKSEPK